MQTLPEITARAILRKNKYIRSCKNTDTLPKWSTSTMLKLIWRQGFTIVLIPTHCYFPCAFFSLLFFNSSGQRRKCYCRREGKECTFQGSCLRWDLDCIKIWVNHNWFASSQDTNRSILKWKAKSKWSTEVKKNGFLKEKAWDNNHYLIIHYYALPLFFLDVVNQEEILYSERNWANKTSIYSSYIRYQVSCLVQCIFRENMSSAINSLMLPVGMSHTQILHPR